MIDFEGQCLREVEQKVREMRSSWIHRPDADDLCTLLNFLDFLRGDPWFPPPPLELPSIYGGETNG